MKKLFMVFSLVVALIGFMSFNVAANQINGAISFSGTVVPNNTNVADATAFTSFGSVVVSDTGGTGDYAPALAGQSVTFTPFQFVPALNPNPLVPLWAFTVGNTEYSFDATGVVVNPWRMSHTISMVGPGIAHITGFDDTPGTWALTANSAGGTASFSASTSVPEPATMLLLGFGLIGLTGLGRKLKR